MNRSLSRLSLDPVWLRVFSISTALFFVFFSDAIISYWLPSFLQGSLGSALIMGLIMSFSSIIGLIIDLLFSQLFKKANVKRMIFYAIILSLCFSIILLISTFYPIILLFLLAMIVWGLYFEFLGFAEKQFVAEAVPLEKRSGAWGLIIMFKNLAFFIGPLTAALLIDLSNQVVVLAAFSLTVVAYVIFVILKFKPGKAVLEFSELNMREEFKCWLVLIKHVWPVIIISLLLGFIDATFWTTGTVLAEKISETNSMGDFFIPLFTLPNLFMGLVLIKLEIFTNKKKLSLLFLFIAGIFLILLGLNSDVSWGLLSVFVIGIMISLAFPLTDAVYSDIIARMGDERKHLIGLSSSTISISYIFGPILAGLISSLVGELLSFTYLGIIVLITTVFLLIFTPRKIRLPQKEIKKW